MPILSPIAPTTDDEIAVTNPAGAACAPFANSRHTTPATDICFPSCKKIAQFLHRPGNPHPWPDVCRRPSAKQKNKQGQHVSEPTLKKPIRISRSHTPATVVDQTMSSPKEQYPNSKKPDTKRFQLDLESGRVDLHHQIKCNSKFAGYSL
ncbi:MAG: hypothetical protein JWN25_2117 [Verrucomicrobiales bacterium]|nr:hypothetical protein [Verrucomicrobiales bacterium]